MDIREEETALGIKPQLFLKSQACWPTPCDFGLANTSQFLKENSSSYRHILLVLFLWKSLTNRHADDVNV